MTIVEPGKQIGMERDCTIGVVLTEWIARLKFVMTQSELKKTSFKQQFVNVFLL